MDIALDHEIWREYKSMSLSRHLRKATFRQVVSSLNMPHEIRARFMGENIQPLWMFKHPSGGFFCIESARCVVESDQQIAFIMKAGNEETLNKAQAWVESLACFQP